MKMKKKTAIMRQNSSIRNIISRRMRLNSYPKWNSCPISVVVVVIVAMLTIAPTVSAFSTTRTTTTTTIPSRRSASTRQLSYSIIRNDNNFLEDNGLLSSPSSSSSSSLESSRRSFLSNSIKSATVAATAVATAGGGGAQSSVAADVPVDPMTMGMMRSSPLPPPSLDAASSKTSLDVGLLSSRVESNVLAPPPYGMEGTDIFYPSWFKGVWKVESKTKSVEAPCGVPLFGGNVTYTNAKQDIGNILKYECRFISPDGPVPTSSSPDVVIADRDYNVRSIVKVAMGPNAVVDVSTATPNKFSCLLAPKGSPTMIKADLIVLNRRQEVVNPNQFDCSEVVREITTPVVPSSSQSPDGGPASPSPPTRSSPILKEIETTSLYTYDPIKDEVRAIQRSAAFLLPSNQNEQAMRMWQLSRGQAIDIRFYDVLYRRPS